MLESPALPQTRYRGIPDGDDICRLSSGAPFRVDASVCLSGSQIKRFHFDAVFFSEDFYPLFKTTLPTSGSVDNHLAFSFGCLNYAIPGLDLGRAFLDR